ncbi:MAG: elongation factor 1-beta [Ferroplasma sp.]|jgi:elongation factor 1-beta|uniref:elongation factor 1-beta n=1 Tax=Ferroplasma sp. TaxID=2591003 RepID=UPI002814FA81|nr:elongation factor 1-beta [Ferroplasma sp.]WMT52134.1 MAG: elongation factor 1-beta [Ferroplasma sp.]
MGDVMVQLRVLPESVEIDLGRLKNEITNVIDKLCKINEVKEEEIGFGLSALMFSVIVPDEEGKIDSVENAISSVEGVSQVDTRDVTLI